MNSPEFFSQSSILQSLGWTLIHFLWQGSALALLLALALGVLKAASAQSRYLAGCLAMLLMGLAPVITLRYEVQLAKPIVTGNSLQPLEEAPVRKDHSQSAQPAGKVTSINGKGVLAVRSPAALSDRIIPWCVTTWCLGVLLLSLRLLASWCRVQWWKHSHREALESVWLAKLDELQARLGIRKKIALLKTSFLETPAVIGWLRPVIFVPASALSGLTPAQLEAILIHELSHIRRHDYLVNLLQSAVETLLFYHPAVWWVSRKIRQERENCCDDMAVQLCGDRCGYARALTTLEHLRGGAPALALAADGGSIGGRVRRILGIRSAAGLNPAWMSGALGLTALAVLLYVSRAVLFANEPQTRTPSTQPTNSVKEVAPPIQASGIDSFLVVMDNPVDWNLIRSNLKNFVSNTDIKTLAEQLHEYFGLRGINVILEDGELDARKVGVDSIFKRSRIDETSQTLKVKIAHAEMAHFGEALRRLSAPFNQIFIEVKWAELHSDNSPTNGLRGLLPQLLASKKGEPLAEPMSNSNLITKPCLGSAVAIQVIGNSQAQTNNIAIEESQPFSAILNQAQFTNLIRTWEQRGGVDILSAPRVTTLSGRQTRVSVEDAMTIVTGFETNSSGKLSPVATPMMFGPTTDIFPELSNDRSEIRLKIIGRLKEFAGYRKPNSKGEFEPIRKSENQGPVPTPRFLEQYYEATETVRIGETVLLGGLTIETQVICIDEIPGLKDIPLLGRLFRKESTAKQWKSIVFIVTPTLVNSYSDKVRAD